MKYSNTSQKAVRKANVMQQDLLLPDLSVRETLQYAADLRLASFPDSAQRIAIVESVILELGLKECADIRTGSSIHKGFWRGEGTSDSPIFCLVVGFRDAVTTFFLVFFLVVVSHYVTITFATLCVATSRTFAGASLFVNLLYTVDSSACGYCVNADQISVHTRWSKWLVSRGTANDC